MKKLLLVLLLLIFPVVVYAKTPNLDETIKIIEDIKNVNVDEGIVIENTVVDGDNIIFKINNEDIKIPYTFSDNKFSFVGGSFTLDNNKVVDIKDNQYAFYLYSILESKSTIPYDPNNYYNNNNIKGLIESDFKTTYRENTNTFGITLRKDEENKYTIIYDYYLDGDYPIIEFDDSDDLENPATGNYNLLITIMLVSVLCVGIYTYVDPKKSK